jgi:hypothetical protein
MYRFPLVSRVVLLQNLSHDMILFKLFACAAAATQAQAASSLTYGPPSFAAPGLFPASLYSSYYNNPTATAAQPQPIISDPVLVRIYTVFVNRYAH